MAFQHMSRWSFSDILFLLVTAKEVTTGFAARYGLRHAITF
jgi:hypothetical protein